MAGILDNKSRIFDTIVTQEGRRQMAEGDFVTAVGTWTINAEMTWDWVQTFRIESGRIVETWLPAFATEGKWTREDVPS